MERAVAVGQVPHLAEVAAPRGQQDGRAARERLRLRKRVAKRRASERRLRRVEPPARGQHERPARRGERENLPVRHGQRRLRAEHALGLRVHVGRFGEVPRHLGALPQRQQRLGAKQGREGLIEEPPEALHGLGVVLAQALEVRQLELGPQLGPLPRLGAEDDEERDAQHDEPDQGAHGRVRVEREDEEDDGQPEDEQAPASRHGARRLQPVEVAVGHGPIIVREARANLPAGDARDGDEDRVQHQRQERGRDPLAHAQDPPVEQGERRQEHPQDRAPSRPVLEEAANEQPVRDQDHDEREQEKEAEQVARHSAAI